MRRLIPISAAVVLAVWLSGCSATNRLTMGITEPAQVTISPDVAKIGIVNRSLPSEKNKNVDKIDQVLSAEGRLLDQEGSQAAIDALAQVLNETGAYESVKIIEDPEIRKGLGILPAQLSRSEVERICRENEVDVLFSLALFDTDTKVSYQATTMTVPNGLGVKVAIPAHELRLNTLIKSGWRVYDNQRKILADEFLCSGEVFSSGKGINPVKAYEAVLNRKEAVMQRSMDLGNGYALRLQPLRRRIARDYYVRGTSNFEMAKRRAQAGDWTGAAQLWEREVAHPKARIAGRACYNMAISNEINGDLDSAIDWASKSYVDYRNNLALRYLNELKFRQRQNDLLNEQLSAR